MNKQADERRDCRISTVNPSNASGDGIHTSVVAVQLITNSIDNHMLPSRHLPTQPKSIATYIPSSDDVWWALQYTSDTALHAHGVCPS